MVNWFNNQSWKSLAGIFLMALGMAYTFLTPFGHISLLLTAPSFVLTVGLWLYFEGKWERRGKN